MRLLKSTRERRKNSFKNWKPNTHHSPRHRNSHHRAGVAQGVIWNSNLAETTNPNASSSNYTRTRLLWRQRTFGVCAREKSPRTRRKESHFGTYIPRFIELCPDFASRRETLPLAMAREAPRSIRQTASTGTPGASFVTRNRDF